MTSKTGCCPCWMNCLGKSQAIAPEGGSPPSNPGAYHAMSRNGNPQGGRISPGIPSPAETRDTQVIEQFILTHLGEPVISLEHYNAAQQRVATPIAPTSPELKDGLEQESAEGFKTPQQRTPHLTPNTISPAFEATPERDLGFNFPAVWSIFETFRGEALDLIRLNPVQQQRGKLVARFNYKIQNVPARDRSSHGRSADTTLKYPIQVIRESNFTRGSLTLMYAERTNPIPQIQLSLDLQEQLQDSVRENDLPTQVHQDARNIHSYVLTFTSCLFGNTSQFVLRPSDLLTSGENDTEFYEAGSEYDDTDLGIAVCNDGRRNSQPKVWSPT